MKKKVTIQDIADALGISRNTVSKAINNSEGLAEATREKILQKAIEMEYKQFSYVNSLAAAMEDLKKDQIEDIRKEKKFRGEIALLTTTFLTQSHFASLMMDKFQREISQLGFTLNTHRVMPEDIAQKTLPYTFIQERCRAIICIEMFDREYDEMICALDLPVLFVDGPAKWDGYSLPADQLYMENATGIARFIHDSISAGRKRIGFIGKQLYCQSFFERYTAYRISLLMAGVEAEEKFIIDAQSAEGIRKELAGLDELPDVFVCANDFVAIDALQVLTEMGKTVPNDVGLFGFDDSPESRLMIPRLTTVHIHTQIMAFVAVNMLLSRLEEPSLDYRIIHTETDLIYRDSTAPRPDAAK